MLHGLLSLHAREHVPARRRWVYRPALEILEDRVTPTGVGWVIDADPREGPASLGALDPAGAATLSLSSPRDTVFNNMPGHPHYHDLFVASHDSHSVLRFDWASQTYQPFVATNSGGLSGTFGLAFGLDGNLYVTAIDQNWVLQFDGTDGHFLGVFVAAGSGGLINASGLTFGPDGDLYVSSGNQNPAGIGQVLKYQGPSAGPNGEQPGQFLGVFANTGDGSTPDELTFGPDGNLYVACPQFNTPTPYDGLVNRYQGPSGVSPGQFIDSFVSTGSGGLKTPRSPVFDSQGHLDIVDMDLKEVLRYQGPSEANPGAYIDAYITSGQGGLNSPIGLAIGPDGNLYVGSRDSNQVTRFSPNSQAQFIVQLDAPSTSVATVEYATADGSAKAGINYVQTSGTLTFAPGETTKTVTVTILDDHVASPTLTFTVNLSNPVNATITTSQIVGTILDKVTKFFIADSSTPRTYQYGSGGTSEEFWQQLSNNTAPRGVATTAAGTTVWVVDANMSVYVYSNHGVLLGSWAATGMPTGAQVTGIATNGTDIWLLDPPAAKVYKYTGAASRLSGSQAAASSFALVSGRTGNTNPQDIVTDGTSFWVADGTTLKVFKYSLSGKSLGSWAIDPANAHPTGIAIDPSNVSNIWIVDNGTLKVYQYTAAAGRTSGSQLAGATFALNPYDTNPQGIADPPPAGTLLMTVATPPAADLPAETSEAATAAGGAPAITAPPSMLGPDAAWALWTGPLQSGTGESLPNPTPDTSFAHSEVRLPSSGRAVTPWEASGGEKPVNRGTFLGRASCSAASSDPADGVPDDSPADPEGRASNVMTDAVFALLADDVSALPQPARAG